MRRLTSASLLTLLAFCEPAACILPLAPEFQEERNGSPFVVSATPAVGTIVGDNQARFEVTIEDPNGTDTLHARWLIDYPPWDQNISRVVDSGPLPPPDGRGQPNRHPLAFLPDCRFNLISPTLSQHRLMLVVTDRPFVDDEPDGGATTDVLLDRTTPGANVIRLVWLFKKECR